MGFKVSGSKSSIKCMNEYHASLMVSSTEMHCLCGWPMEEQYCAWRIPQKVTRLITIGSFLAYLWNGNLWQGQLLTKYICISREGEYLALGAEGCRKGSRGTKDHLIIDKAVLKDCKNRHTMLAMAWIDYMKTYDMVPHSWICECLELFGVAENVRTFFTIQ